MQAFAELGMQRRVHVLEECMQRDIADERCSQLVDQLLVMNIRRRQGCTSCVAVMPSVHRRSSGVFGNIPNVQKMILLDKAAAEDVADTTANEDLHRRVWLERKRCTQQPPKQPCIPLPQMRLTRHSAMMMRC